ncbi:helix-turn-helix domain-containing protein [Pseudorhodobacter sp. W20_MBD10_FR17]|uniref:helix-turn-helix domain-containing protein n=1 Tax=Pseudorhodobacter sp. W20_MBD10_FR17 TaxID=3240266 RepID=UPI003F9A8534
MSGKDFYLMQIEWTRQVRKDRKMPDKAVRIADAIAFDFMNKDVGEAWPSMATLCAHVDASERAVRRVLDQLVQGGHLAIKSGGGRRQSNRYKWILSAGNSGKNAVVSGGETPASAEEFTKPKRKRNSGTFGAKTTANMPEEPLQENHLKKQTGAGGPDGRKAPGSGSVAKAEDKGASGKVLASQSTASNSGEAPLDGATPAYAPDAIQAAKDAAHKWLASQYNFDAGHVDDLIDGFGPAGCAAARDDAAAALTEALSGLPLNIAAQKVEVYSQTALELLRAVHGGSDLRREVYDMGRVVMNHIGMTGERHVG